MLIIAMEKFVSVIIPAADDAQPLARCIEKVLKQDFPKKEVVVAVGPKVKEPAQTADGATSVRFVRERKSVGVAHLINAGMRAAKGNIKVLLMPECVPAGSHWLEGMMEPFGDENVGVVVAQCRLPDKKRLGLASRLMNSIDCPETPDVEKRRAPQTVGHLCDAYRASMLADLGYLEDELFPTPGEAVDMSVRVADAGYNIVISPDATVFYHRGDERSRFGDVLARSLDYGYADGALSRRYQMEWLNCRVFAAALLALGLVPLGLISLPVAWMAAALLFLWGWFLPFKLFPFPWSWPVGVLNLATYVAMIIAIRGDWAPWLFGRRLHPAIIRQWCFLGAITASYLAIVTGRALSCTWHSLARDRSILYGIPIFFLAIIWWLGTGIGYIKAMLFARNAGG